MARDSRLPTLDRRSRGHRRQTHLRRPSSSFRQPRLSAGKAQNWSGWSSCLLSLMSLFGLSPSLSSPVISGRQGECRKTCALGQRIRDEPGKRATNSPKTATNTQARYPHKCALRVRGMDARCVSLALTHKALSWMQGRSQVLAIQAYQRSHMRLPFS